MTFRDEYLDAAAAFAGQVARLPRDAWESPALGTWTLRQLVGHTASSLSAVAEATRTPPATVDLEHGHGYYALRRTVDPAFLEAAVAAAAEGLVAETAALGDDPHRTVPEQLAAARAALDAVDDDALVVTPAGGMVLRAWLPTRTFELAVHALDIADATGVAADLPASALRGAVSLAATTGVEVGDGAGILRALTGRGTLPAGFSVL